MGSLKKRLTISYLLMRGRAVVISTHPLAYSSLVQLFVCSSQDKDFPTILAAKLSPCFVHSGNGSLWRHGC